MLRLQTDERLLALARAGHEPAFGALFERYRTPLTRYCTRLLGAARAEDAVQQTFVSAHGAMMKNNDDIKLKPWLYRIAHNASLNLLRSSHETAELDAESAGRDSVAEVVELRERLNETLTAIGALPERQRDALLLRELEGRSHEEIAIALGVTEGSARQHLMRARATVRSAVTALTPYPLAVKAAAAMAGGMTQTAGVSELVAGAGVTATIAKVSAGVLATGAIVAGASEVHVLPHRTHHHATPAVIARPVSDASGASSASGPGAAGTASAGAQGAGHGANQHSGKGRSGGRHGTGKRTSSSGRTQSATRTPADHRSGRHSGPGSTTQPAADVSRGSHRQSGRHGSHSGTVESTTATEAPHVEIEAPGDVSNKPASAGGGGTGGGGGGGATTTPAPAPTTPDPTATTPSSSGGSSGGGGGSSQPPAQPPVITP